MGAKPLRHAEPVMGTVVSFTVFPDGAAADPARERTDGEPGTPQEQTDSEPIAALVRRACDGLHRDDRMFSCWKAESPMSRHRSGRLRASDLPAEVREVLERCNRLRALTAGWFDPWAMPGGVDPSGLVKGWAAQRALTVLVDGGVTSAMVNAGGDLATAGTPPGAPCWRVAIRHPWQPTAFAAVVASPGAVATSGNYERPGQLLDPTTGAVSTTAASATVVGPDLGVADALATALAVGGAEMLDRVGSLAGYDAYLIAADGSEAATDAMPFLANCS